MVPILTQLAPSKPAYAGSPVLSGCQPESVSQFTNSGHPGDSNQHGRCKSLAGGFTNEIVTPGPTSSRARWRLWSVRTGCHVPVRG